MCNNNPFPPKSPPLKGGLGGANKTLDVNPVEALRYQLLLQWFGRPLTSM